MPDTAVATRSFTLQLTVTLTAVIHPEPDAGGFSAEVPALPGCYTQGKTLEEVQANLWEAAEAWLASAHDHAQSSLFTQCQSGN
jgi:predicted RNase H-like HicB family nuclease